jgi:hypothetical protein
LTFVSAASTTSTLGNALSILALGGIGAYLLTQFYGKTTGLNAEDEIYPGLLAGNNFYAGNQLANQQYTANQQYADQVNTVNQLNTINRLNAVNQLKARSQLYMGNQLYGKP